MWIQNYVKNRRIVNGALANHICKDQDDSNFFPQHFWLYRLRYFDIQPDSAVWVVHIRGRINQTPQLFPRHWHWFILYPSLSVSDTHHTDSAEVRRDSNRVLNDRYKHKNTCWSSVRKANFPSNGDEVNTIILEFPGKLVSQWKECPPSGLSKKNKHPVGINRQLSDEHVC